RLVVSALSAFVSFFPVGEDGGFPLGGDGGAGTCVPSLSPGWTGSRSSNRGWTLPTGGGGIRGLEHTPCWKRLEAIGRAVGRAVGRRRKCLVGGGGRLMGALLGTLVGIPWKWD